MDTAALKQTLAENAHVALEHTDEGARMRRRVVAVGGFTLLVLGFLAAVGLGRLILIVLLVALGAGLALMLVRQVRRRSVLTHAGDAVRASRAAGRRAMEQAGETTRQRADARRARKSEKQERSSRSRSKDDAGRLNTQGIELRRRGQPEAAVEAHRAALELAQTAGDASAQAMTLNNLGLALASAGDEPAAIVHFDAAVSVLREIADEHHEGQVLANLGFLHGRSGRREQAVYCLEAALDKLDRDSRAFEHVQEQLRRAS
jgi:tetratricopeptide (TPR) repeat protein